MARLTTQIIIVLLGLTGSLLLAQDTEPTPPNENQRKLSGQERLRRYVTLSRQTTRLLSEKKYEEAVSAFHEMIELAPHNPSPRYNLACGLSRLGKRSAAMQALTESIERGFADPAHMRQDEDLAAVREEPGFADLVKKAELNRKKRLPHKDKATEINGVKTVERSPPDGLPYRLRMSPDATMDHPHRLIVWLHPAGGSANRVVERLSPHMIKHDYALMVLTQKRWSSWTSGDADRLIKHTLPDAGKIGGIDVGKPILMGYSAGGQMALQLWSKQKGEFGGLILDAAYPIDLDHYGKTRRAKAMPLPEADAIKSVPMFVLVGEKDGGSQLWKQVEPEWKKAGVPLTVHYIPGKGHQWLFGDDQISLLEQWLQSLREK